MMHSMLIMKFGCIHAHNFFPAMYKRNNVSFNQFIPPQSRQSARLSLQSSGLAPPAHSPATRKPVFPPSLGGGGGVTIAGGRGGGGANSDEGTGTLVL
jgi:hypothetical protein